MKVSKKALKLAARKSVAAHILAWESDSIGDLGLSVEDEIYMLDQIRKIGVSLKAGNCGSSTRSNLEMAIKETSQ